MKYHVVLKPRAIKDLKDLPKEEASKIIDRLALLEDNLKGDVKRLTHVTPEYRMRSGNYRVLLELEEDRIICIVLNIERIFIDDASPSNN